MCVFFHGFPDPAITLGTSGANKGGGADGAGLGRGATGALHFDGYDDDGGGAYIVLRKPKGMVGSGEREREREREREGAGALGINWSGTIWLAISSPVSLTQHTST